MSSQRVSVESACIAFSSGSDATGTVFTDTWEYDGAAWSRAQPASRPPPEFRRAMAFDSSRQRVVLLQGTRAPTTWEYDGATWTQRLPTTSPPFASPNAMAWDAARQRVVFFDGSTLWAFLP